MNMDMNQEKNQKNRNPHHDGGSMLAQVQASVEILSPVPVGCKCGEKDGQIIKNIGRILPLSAVSALLFR